MAKISSKQMIVIALIVVVLYFLLKSQPATADTSYYTPQGMNLDDDEQYASIDFKPDAVNFPCQITDGGIGLSSSLLPREMPSASDWGQFSPDLVLKGQNFLNVRDQVGFPEVIGGSLRNANHQLRADPPVARKQFVWNNSTIPPDTMQRTLGCTGH